MAIPPSVQSMLPLLTRHRRALHRIPEPGLAERRTQAYLLDALTPLHPDLLEQVADTGIRAVFRGQQGGRVVAFRADMDALPIEEENRHDYVSTHPGMMHACGHDGHMAVLLGFAVWLADHRKDLLDTVVLLFQPAEESVGGAARMIEAGALRDPDVTVIYALHMMPDLQKGKLGACAGPMMAGTCEFDVELRGQAAHGAQPHKGLDTVAAAAALIAQMQTIVSRRIDPCQPALLTVGKITAGERRNIIAERAYLECSMRAFDPDTLEQMRALLREMLRGIEESYGVQAALYEQVYYPSVVNPQAETEAVFAALGEDMVEVPPKMIAEDFSFFQRAVPGVYLYLGCAEPGYEHPLHTPRFDFDETALVQGLDAFVRLVGWQEAKG